MTRLFIWMPPSQKPAASPNRKCFPHGVVPAVSQAVDDTDHSIDCPCHPADDLGVAFPVNVSLERHDAVADSYPNGIIRGEHKRRDDAIGDLFAEVLISAQE